ncbi:MAG: cyclic nucleotide-binding domain-containing protein [Anaerolineales bacterium]|nr:cyclic nucleotide-binding domain-containing protein [Anaerolineales bacterium]
MNITSKDLAKVIVFQNATEDDLQLILKNCIIRSIEEGGFFFFQGDLANYFYILSSGQTKLMQSNPNGQQVNLRTIHPWQMFGALELSAKRLPTLPLHKHWKIARLWQLKAAFYTKCWKPVHKSLST